MLNQPDTFIIVSGIVKSEFSNNRMIVPDDQVYKDGKVIGCLNFRV